MMTHVIHNKYDDAVSRVGEQGICHHARLCPRTLDPVYLRTPSPLLPPPLTLTMSQATLPFWLLSVSFLFLFFIVFTVFFFSFLCSLFSFFSAWRSVYLSIFVNLLINIFFLQIFFTVIVSLFPLNFTILLFAHSKFNVRI